MVEPDLNDAEWSDLAEIFSEKAAQPLPTLQVRLNGELADNDDAQMTLPASNANAEEEEDVELIDIDNFLNAAGRHSPNVVPLDDAGDVESVIRSELEENDSSPGSPDIEDVPVLIDDTTVSKQKNTSALSSSDTSVLKTEAKQILRDIKGETKSTVSGAVSAANVARRADISIPASVSASGRSPPSKAKQDDKSDILRGVSAKGVTKPSSGFTLKEKREREAQRFPSDLLRNLDGTTSAEVRKMNSEERELVLYKRKLRNRESARRSRQKRQTTVAELREELDELLFVSSALVDKGMELEDENEALKAKLEIAQAELRSMKAILSQFPKAQPDAEASPNKMKLGG